MNTDLARRQMVEQQLRTWDVFDDSVLTLFDSVPRDQYVPPGFRSLAFADCQIPLGNGQSMMTPSVEGRLLQALAVAATDDVLEIGTGSGFLTACLARQAATVVSIDLFEAFVEAARRKLDAHGVNNVTLHCMDALAELPDGEFDVIAVTGSLHSEDRRLLERLRPGGRLFIVTGDAPVMEAKLIVHDDTTGWHASGLFETSLDRLRNAAEPSTFAF